MTTLKRPELAAEIGQRFRANPVVMPATLQKLFQRRVEFEADHLNQIVQQKGRAFKIQNWRFEVSRRFITHPPPI